MSHHRREQRYLIEHLEPQPHSNRHHVAIHDRRTGKSRTFYREEFIRSQMHYEPDTAKYPAYVLDEVFRK